MKLAHLTFDCADPLALSAFWAGALGAEVDEGASKFFARISRADGPDFMFLMVDEGKTAKNRLHIDMETETPETDVERLLALGASKMADKAEWGHEWAVLQDPEGNEFCVSGPHA